MFLFNKLSVNIGKIYGVRKQLGKKKNGKIKLNKIKKVRSKEKQGGEMKEKERGRGIAKLIG